MSASLGWFVFWASCAAIDIYIGEYGWLLPMELAFAAYHGHEYWKE